MTDPGREKKPRRLVGTATHMLGFGLLLALVILLAKGRSVPELIRASNRARQMPLSQL